ncbi:GNAT family N-acetyltransferase [Nocardia sp. CA-119907]|uniref:GNAT family N-acetyltransferase n=1 Tax=Nocardia sp. CA-119907 TaxID=3239973 RepID=UPI003D99A5F2
MFVRPDARGEGRAAELLGCAESAARELGTRAIRLNTRKDLVEARALYTKHGYVEIPPYCNNPLADHWFEMTLR